MPVLIMILMVITMIIIILRENLHHKYGCFLKKVQMAFDSTPSLDLEIFIALLKYALIYVNETNGL